MSSATGHVTGSNPHDTGGSTWSGLADAANTRTFECRQVSSALTIAELSIPSIRVDIDVPVQGIGSLAWAAIPFADGNINVGIAGSDYLLDDFYGLEHQDVYSVFEADHHTGAFGVMQ